MIYLTISSLIFIITGYAINILLGKQLGTSEYGIYGVIISLMTVVNIIQTSGLPQATTKFIADGKNNINNVLKASLIVQTTSTIVVSLVFFIASPFLAYLLNDNSLTQYIRATSFILPLYAIFTLYVGYYNGLHNFKRQALLNISYSLSKLILVIALVYVFHLYGAIIGFIVSPIIALLFGFKLPKNVKVEKTLYKSLILFSLPLIGYAILSTLQLSIDLFFVKSLTHDNQVAGLYTAGQNIARIPYYALSAFALMLFPIVTKSIHNENPVETGKKIKNTLRYLLLLLVPGTLLIAITSSDLLKLLYTSSYISAASSLSILVVGLAFLTILNALTYVLVGADRPVATMVISGAGVAITSIVCLALIPRYGLNGASIATTVGGAITTVIAFIMISRRFPKIIPWVSLLKITIATSVIYIISMAIHLPTLLLPVTYIIHSLIYAILLIAFREITLDDLAIIKRLLPQRTSNILPHE